MCDGRVANTFQYFQFMKRTQNKLNRTTVLKSILRNFFIPCPSEIFQFSYRVKNKKGAFNNSSFL